MYTTHLIAYGFPVMPPSYNTHVLATHIHTRTCTHTNYIIVIYIYIYIIYSYDTDNNPVAKFYGIQIIQTSVQCDNVLSLILTSSINITISHHIKL